jgi:hypothetical protein
MFAPDSHNNRLVVVQALSRFFDGRTEYRRDELKSHLEFPSSCHIIDTLAKFDSFGREGDSGVEELRKPPRSGQLVALGEYWACCWNQLALLSFSWIGLEKIIHTTYCSVL